MAKQRAGYVYQEIFWSVEVTYAVNGGKRQKVIRRAKSQKRGEEVAEGIIAKLHNQLGNSLKVSQEISAESASWVARFTYTDETGKRRDVKLRADSKTEAKEELKKLINKFDAQGEQSIEGDKLTFRELARFYEERNLVPAEYHGDRKIRGLRNHLAPRVHLRVVTEHFGAKRIKSITHSDIEVFRQLRLKAKTKRGKVRTIATVNRELEQLRAVLRFAVRQGWLLRSPFDMGAPLIAKADEVRRERVLTHEEEARLLAVCTGRRAHLKAILIAALDTGARRGELFKLTWVDVDFDNRLINLRATTTKTQRSRTIGMTARLYIELLALYHLSDQSSDNLVFGFSDNVKKSFASACREARIAGFRFHDCRHTAITRMIQSGMPSQLIMKVSGHTQAVTFSRYVNADEGVARQAANALDRFNQACVVDDTQSLIN
ncbi:MAG: site-specific integrase [Blastocatellia bacterium]